MPQNERGLVPSLEMGEYYIVRKRRDTYVSQIGSFSLWRALGLLKTTAEPLRPIPGCPIEMRGG